MIDSSLSISHPDWLDQVVDATRRYPDDESRIRLAIGLARANVEHDTGGPFGAAVVEAESGRLVAVGVNAVVRLKNSVLHAEMMAFMMAERALGSYTLRAPGMPEHALYS